MEINVLVGCLGVVWELFGGCLGTVWELFVGCLGGYVSLLFTICFYFEPKNDQNHRIFEEPAGAEPQNL